MQKLIQTNKKINEVLLYCKTCIEKHSESPNLTRDLLERRFWHVLDVFKWKSIEKMEQVVEQNISKQIRRIGDGTALQLTKFDKISWKEWS